MAVNKEMIKQIWNYVVKPQLEKLVKRSTSPIDDFILRQMDNAIKDYLAQK